MKSTRNVIIAVGLFTSCGDPTGGSAPTTGSAGTGDTGDGAGTHGGTFTSGSGTDAGSSGQVTGGGQTTAGEQTTGGGPTTSDDTDPGTTGVTGGEGETTGGTEEPPPADVIPRSMVLFTQVPSATPENVTRFAADGVFWGHMPEDSISTEEDMRPWHAQVQEIIDRDLAYFGRGEFDWGWRWFTDFATDPGEYHARDLNGEAIPFVAGPAGQGYNHNGHGWFWWSHHGPEFGAWLKFQVDQLLTAPITHIMFDSQTSGTRTAHWLGGDFSPHAMAGFREHLRGLYRDDELAALGIQDVTTFDYRTYLVDRGFDLQSYKNGAYGIPGSIPLYDQFVYYQRAKLAEVMTEALAHLHARAPHVLAGATTSLLEPRGFFDTEHLDYIAGEYSHLLGPLHEVPFNPILQYKAAEALGKQLIFFTYPQSWQEIQAQNAPRHARTWIAQAYAMGAIFTIPGTIWMGHGQPAWNPGAENYEDLYRFVDRHSSLLDEYDAHSNVGFVYSVLGSLNAGGMEGNDVLKASIRTLTESNYSFDLLPFGDPGDPFVPDASRLDRYDVLVADGDLDRLTLAQREVLDASSAPLVSLSDTAAVALAARSKIDVVGSLGEDRNASVSALPRRRWDRDSPYVIHLVNRDYDPYADQSVVHTGLELSFGMELFPDTVTGATLHTLDGGSADVEVTTDPDDADRVRIRIGTLAACWAIVELTHGP